ncbi:KilA-N domain-containing protein [Myxococcus guangdongensis]|uniref:KilA-N domain-containing protein n=1 Tax=Myxococcus guangdongensis TaxID=2906760 RepID=UPI003898DA28
MSCPSQQLTIGDVVAQQDAHGRYSLNDLHGAAGGEPRHQPSNFLRNESTRGLITELTRSSDSMNGPVGFAPSSWPSRGALHNVRDSHETGVTPLRARGSGLAYSRAKPQAVLNLVGSPRKLIQSAEP